MSKITAQANAFKSALQILRNSFREYPRQSIIVIISIIITGFAEFFSLLTFIPLLNIGIGGRNDLALSDNSPIEHIISEMFSVMGLTPDLKTMLILLVVLITLKSFSSLLTRAYVGVVLARVATDLRINLIKSLLNTSWQHFVTQPTGRFSNAISSEAQRASNTYLSSWNMVGAAIQIAFFMAASAAVSIEVLIFGILAGILITGLLHWTVKLSRAAGGRETFLMNSLIGRLTDNITGIKPMKAMGLEKKVLPFLIGNSEELRKAQYKQAFAIAAQKNLAEPMMIFIMAIGAYYAIEHSSITLAHMAVIALFFSRMVGRMSELQKYYQMINTSESAYHSIKSAINIAQAQAPLRIGKQHNVDLYDKISVQNIYFSYKGKDGAENIFENFNVDIPAHKLTTLVGPSGCGKTTLVDMVIGMMEPDQGDILIDGVSLKDIDYIAWQSRIGYVPQELYLFNDTVRNNITFRDEQYSDDDIWAALEACGAKYFVEALSRGLDSQIGERGSKISGGQRQRLMIARALVRKPALLILDEATTALDPETERALCENIKGMAQNVTILAISHQAAIRDIADHIIDLTKQE